MGNLYKLYFFLFSLHVIRINIRNKIAEISNVPEIITKFICIEFSYLHVSKLQLISQLDTSVYACKVSNLFHF